MFLQFASNGIWETALRLELPANQKILKAWLKSASDDVALELFFGEAEFLGLRLKPFQHEAELLRFCANPSIESLRKKFNAPELFRGIPAFAEIGVVNAWQSLGSKVIWQQGEAIPKLENLELWLRPRPIALEFAYTQPLPHWQALPVSVKTEQGYRLDLNLLKAALNRQINGEKT